MSKIRMTHAILLATLFLLLSACTKTPEQQSELLKARVNARWDAVIAVDFDKVYTFATPTYRETYDLKHFHNQYAAQVERTRIDIARLKFLDEANTRAEITIELFFKSDLGGTAQAYEGSAFVKETWVREGSSFWSNGEWYRVEEK